mgnify:CR=1 FL=1
MAFDATDLAHTERRVDTGHIIGGLAQHHRDPRPRIWRATHDLLLALVGHHAAHTQPIRIRMLLGMQHLGQGKCRQTRCRVDNFLHLKPEVRKRFRNLLDARLRVEMLFQPGECEFHDLKSVP